MTRAITKAVVGIVLCLSLLLPGLANAEVWFNRIITFGDSLSDPGSYFLLTGDFEVRPFTEPIPDSPYLIGLFHFSNGPTWIERLAKDFCMPASGKSALLFPRVYTNYAVGRSRARQPGDTLTPICKLCDLTSQVNRFLLRDFPRGAPSNALYVVFIGSNDLSDALSAEGDLSIIENAVTSTCDNIRRLSAAGAKTFLVANLPNAARTPYVKFLDFFFPGTLAAAKALKEYYNFVLLEPKLQELEATLPVGTEIKRFKVFELLEYIANSDDHGGFENVEDSCINFDVTVGQICAHPNEYLFWDGIHPTTAGHRALKDCAKELLTEP